MRIAFLVNEFPVISEAFFLDQITWLIQQGCEVDIYAQRLCDQSLAQPEVAAHSLMDRAFQLLPSPVPSKSVRIARAFRDVAWALPQNPGVVARALCPSLFGRNTVRLKPFNLIIPFLARPSYDVVHCHFGPNGMMAVELRDLGAIRAPILTQFHGYDVSSYVRDKGEQVYRNLFAKGDVFLCVSERIRTRLVNWGCDKRKTRIQHVGVKVKDIPFTTRAVDVGETIQLITVARLVEKKGIEFGLRAVARLIHEYPNLKYTIVGDGPERDTLTSLVLELGIGNHVNLLGAKNRETVLTLMRDAHVLLAPSITAHNGDEEGIPVVLMEALASGLPVVSTTHAGIPELVEHGVTGLLAPERAPEELANHVRFLIAHPSECRAMALSGRRTVERGFDVDELNAQLFAEYIKISKRRR